MKDEDRVTALVAGVCLVGALALLLFVVLHPILARAETFGGIRTGFMGEAISPSPPSVDSSIDGALSLELLPLPVRGADAILQRPAEITRKSVDVRIVEIEGERYAVLAERDLLGIVAAAEDLAAEVLKRKACDGWL